jgi:hypothetical protein
MNIGHKGRGRTEPWHHNLRQAAANDRVIMTIEG